MLDAESARGSCVDGGRTIEYDVAYLPYDVAVCVSRRRSRWGSTIFTTKVVLRVVDCRLARTRREKLHLRDAIEVLAGLIETEVRHVNADFDTSLPTMNRSDYIEADTWIRNKLNKDPLRRIEVDSERSLYPTHEFLAEIDAVLTLSDASDDDRSEQRRRIIHSRLTIFLNFYEHTMLRGRAPSRDDPAYKFKSMLSMTTRLVLLLLDLILCPAGSSVSPSPRCVH